MTEDLIRAATSSGKGRIGAMGILLKGVKEDGDQKAKTRGEATELRPLLISSPARTCKPLRETGAFTVVGLSWISCHWCHKISMPEIGNKFMGKKSDCR